MVGKYDQCRALLLRILTAIQNPNSRSMVRIKILPNSCQPEISPNRGTVKIQWKPLNRDASGVRILYRLSDVNSIVRYEFVPKMSPKLSGFHCSTILSKMTKDWLYSKKWSQQLRDLRPWTIQCIRRCDPILRCAQWCQKGSYQCLPEKKRFSTPEKVQYSGKKHLWP